MNFDIKKAELTELTDDKNYSEFKRVYEKGSFDHLKGGFVAYQSGKMVYIDYNKESLDTLAEKLTVMDCKEPILILQVGSDSQHYLTRPL